MKNVISVSRRTDLPRWFMDDVLEWFSKGHVAVKNPFSKQLYDVSLTKEDVHSICWWSKDFSRFLDACSAFEDYNQFFNFTINGYSDPELQFLEPGMTSTLDDRIEQAKILSERYGPGAIQWRFDPIVYWKDGETIKNTLGDFERIAGALSSAGISRCVISFATWYGKCVKRARKKNFEFVDPSLDQKREASQSLARIAAMHGMKVYACCNDGIVDNNMVQKSSCIDGALLSSLFGEPASLARDAGQRETCGCT